jgi:homocysteine S-methyltransferase
MLDFKTYLDKQKFVVVDGAFATELERLGLDIKDPLWSALALIDHTDMIEKVHTMYLKAGADIIISSSYQATVDGFAKKGINKDKALSLIALSVDLAVKARDEFVKSSDFDSTKRQKPLVAASVGPYGAYLADGSEYRGDYKIGLDELKAFHKERLAVLASASPDLFACETIPNLTEALAILGAIEDLKLDVPAYISFSCKDGEHISDGTSIRDCASALNEFSNVVAVGLNCTAPKYVESLIQILTKSTDKPVIVYPNSGEIYNPFTKTWSGGSVSFSERAVSWYRAGARLIGGCCRTTPEDIKAISDFARN